jgi:two-component system response regulator NreC
MTLPERIRILVADDHAVLRAGLRVLLTAEEDLEVVGEAATGEDAVQQIRECRPDVAVVDISMPGLGGVGAMRRIATLGLQTKVVVFTMHPEEEYLFPVLDAGGSGFVTKSSADRDLVDAVRCAARGEVYLSPHATILLLRRYRAGERRGEGDGLHGLTHRERETLALTAEGYTASEIGRKLYLSPKTVDTYRARIARKLGLTHRSELVKFALRHGLLKPPQEGEAPHRRDT